MPIGVIVIYCLFFSKLLSILKLVGVGLYCKMFCLTFSGETTEPLIHLSLGKAVPFTLENHIHVKALKMQDFLLNLHTENSIVWMLPYCAHKLLR